MRHKFKNILLALAIAAGALLLPLAAHAVVCNVLAGCTGLGTTTPAGLLVSTSSPKSLTVVPIGTSDKVLSVISGLPSWGGVMLNSPLVAGVNATSSTHSFNIQGSGTLNPFNVASSTGTSLFRILANGNVGIGTTTPGSVLTVVGTARMDNTDLIVCDRGGQVYNVKCYGAVGDGITDNTGAIQAAVNAASSTMGSVYLPHGTFSTGLIQLKNHVNIICSGIGSTVIKAKAGIGDNPVLYYGGSSSTTPLTDVTISSCEFDGSDVPQTPTTTNKKAIYIVYGERVVIDHVYAHDFPSTCIGPDFLINSIISNILVARCGTPGANPGHNGLGVGIGASNSEPLVVSNVIAWDNANNGLLFEYVGGSQNSKNVKVTNVIAYGNKMGFRVSGGSNITLEGCSIYDNTDQGVYVQLFGGANSPGENFTMSNCDVYDNGDNGVESLTQDFVDANMQINSSRIHGNTGEGVKVGGDKFSIFNSYIYENDKTGVWYYGNSNKARKAISLSGNTVWNNGLIGVAAEDDGFRIESLSPSTSTIDSVIVSNNHFFDDQATSTQDYGLTLKANVNNVLVEGNIFGTHKTGAVSEVSVPVGNTINYRNNIGKVDNYATFQIGTTTSVSTLALQGAAGSNNILTISSSTGATLMSLTAAGALTLTTPLAVSSGGTGTTTWTSGSIPFYNGTRLTESNTNFFWDNANGRLGIGTSSPMTQLDVGSGGAITGGLAGGRVMNIATNQNAVYGVQMENMSAGTAAEFRFLIRDTTDHYFTFSQPGAGNTAALFGQTRSTIDPIFSNGGTGRILTIGTVQAQPILFGTTNLARMLISSGGLVGINIGTATPATQLQVKGAGTTDVFDVSSSTGTSILRISALSTVGINSSTPQAVLVAEGLSGSTLDVFNAASSTHASSFVVKAAGNVGINTTTPAYKLVVAGTVQMPNLTASAGLQTGVMCLDAAGQLINDSVACLASARRFKTDIQPLPVGLSEVLKLNPVEFKWTKEFNQGFENDPNKNGVQYSLVADDVQKVDPKLVTVEIAGKDKGLVHGLADLNHWVAVFVQSFKDMEKQILAIVKKDKEQDKKIQQLEKQLNKQQEEIDLLKSKLNN